MSKNVVQDPLLTEDENRFVMFPIQHDDIWAMYKKQVDCFWRVEEVDLSKDGKYQVRTKGIFTIHGVAQERILKNEITVKNHSINIISNFSVLLSDHNIPIPKVVYQKLVNEILVEVNATLLPR